MYLHVCIVHMCVCMYSTHVCACIVCVCVCVCVCSTHVEKEMSAHSSTRPWKIPWMEEPGGLQSMGSLRVWHDWTTSFSLFTSMRWRRKWQPTPLFLPRESHGQRSLVGVSSRGLKAQTQLEWLSSSSIQYLFFSSWHTPSVWQSLGPFMALQMAYCVLLLLNNIPLHICTHHLYLFLCWWTFRLLSCPG